MAVAGKVAITLSTENGGAWSADVTYDRLVAVKHNNNLYISRKTVANVEPPNDEFWFLALEGFGGDDVQALIDRMNELSDLIQAIIDGTTQVGNAKTLDGHEAEDFFPSAGGEIKGNVLLRTNEEGKGIVFRLLSLLRDVNMQITTDGSFIIHDATNKKGIIQSTTNGTNTFNGTASGNLPLTGGEVTGVFKAKTGSEYPLRAENTNARSSYTAYYGTDGGWLGALGFNTSTPSYRDTSGGTHELLHTGNKPTGSYTGNGSATKRTINVGGIGSICCVKGNYFTAIVHENGAFLMSATATGVIVLTKEQMNFNNGILTIATDSSAVNGNGIVYEYNIP